MPRSDQGIDQRRYMFIPRVLIFVHRGERVLLLKGAAGKRSWAKRYNGVGGHVERGEDVLSAARRELREETGLDADLHLCGTVTVDAGREAGVVLFVFTGDCPRGEPKPSAEGSLEWISFSEAASLPTVEDLPALLDHLQRMRPGNPPFAARAYYDRSERLIIEFIE